MDLADFMIEESNTPHGVRLNVKCAQRDRAKCALQRAYQSALNNFTHRIHLQNLEINIGDMAAVEMEDVAELMSSMSTYLFSMPELRLISWEFSNLQFDLMQMRPYFESLRTQKGLYFDRVFMESNTMIRYERMMRQPQKPLLYWGEPPKSESSRMEEVSVEEYVYWEEISTAVEERSRSPVEKHGLRKTLSRTVICSCNCNAEGGVD
ncbi:unnamed protein product [Toxocara canis]|uniref:RGS domain-containing protein n=1 Tax=Toxocara canis TaxID=6265 RepID=A0A183USB9_TOXCA|nr:unnamed protein product [Toxocara canis]